MHRRRFFLTEPFAGGKVPLRGGDLHHLCEVLRAGPGDVIEAVTPGGELVEVMLETIGVAVVTGAAVGRRPPASASSPHLALCHGISKGEKMDLVVQKATELGVAAVAPFLCERSVVRLDALPPRETPCSSSAATAIVACESGALGGATA